MTAEGDNQPIEATLEQIRAGIRIREAGEVEQAREHLSSLWPTVCHQDPFARLFLAHSLADVQQDPDEELRWDVIALDSFAEVTERRAGEQGVPGGRRGLLPSLYLNLAHDYARLGRADDALCQYRLAAEHLDALGDDPYGDQLRQAHDDFRGEYPALFQRPAANGSVTSTCAKPRELS